MFNFNVWLSAFIVSFSQLVFSDRILSGLFVWLGLFFLYPWNAIGGLVATIIAVTIHRFLSIYTTQQQAAGWSGFNAAIVGLFWGGALANNSYSLLVLAGAIVILIALEAVLTKNLNRWGLPILSSPAMIVVLLFSLLLSQNGEWYWVGVLASYWQEIDRYLGIACIIIAMSLMSFGATGWALALAAIVYTSILIAGFDISEHVALWALNIPLGVFAALAIFFVVPIHKIYAAVITIVVICLVWIIWYITPLNNLVQPIVIPMIIGLWSALLIINKYQNHDYLSPRFWKLVEELRAVNNNQLPIYLMHVVDQQNRTQLEQILIRNNSGDFTYRDNELWRLGKKIKDAKSSSLLNALVSKYTNKFFDTVFTFDVSYNYDNQSINLRVLNESSDATICIQCGAGAPWPEIDLWKYAPLACENCSQPLVPGSLLSWFSSAYLHKNLSHWFDHPCCIVMLTVSTDPLIGNFMSFVNSKNEIKVLFIAKELGLHDSNWEEKLLKRLKRITKILNVESHLRIFSFRQT